MKYIEVVAQSGSAETILAIANKAKAVDVRFGVVCDDGMQVMRLLVADEHQQFTLDALQTVLGAQPTARISVIPVEASLPVLEVPESKTKKHNSSAAREALYENVAKGGQLDANYFVLVVLSTVVAAIGLLENNVAVIIGAMVIAPLLSPNLAFSLGTALGDVTLMKKAALTLSAGLSLAIVLSYLIGLFWPDSMDSHELLMRTHAGWESVVLALASGAAAALSLTTGLSSVLVGVMVAVALLPPAATVGLMLADGQGHLALGAALLLAINIVSVNLSSKLIFYTKGVMPRTLLAKEKAKGAMRIYIVGWVVALSLLLLAVYIKQIVPAG